MPTIQDDIAGLISTEQRSDFSRAVAYKQRVRLAERGIREYLNAVDALYGYANRFHHTGAPRNFGEVLMALEQTTETAESNLRQILSALA